MGEHRYTADPGKLWVGRLDKRYGGQVALLDGYRVLDATGEWGLMAGRLLADLGADVVQVEPPAGSSGRTCSPLAGSGSQLRSMYWEAFAANKRGIVCDPERDEDVELLLTLIEQADFYFTADDPVHLAEVGLDWSSVSVRNPGLVHVHISPFGLTGPKAAYAASDLVVWAASGALHPNRDEERPPMRLSTNQATLHAGADAAVGALIAHRYRLRTGHGQFVEISAQVSSAMATISRMLAYAAHDDAPGWGFDQGGSIDRSGSGSATPSIQRKWRCKDGYIEMHLAMGAAAGRFTEQLCAWMRDHNALPAEFEDIDWRTLPDQIEQGVVDRSTYTRFRAAVATFIETQTKEEANDAALAYRLGCSGIRTVRDVVEAAHFAERGFWVDLDDGDKAIRLPGRFANVSIEAFSHTRRAPRIGEHTEEVLAEWLAEKDPRTMKQVISGKTGGAALEGLKVLDLSWVVAGPMIGRALADFGATVVRVESETHADTTRRMKPHFEGKPGLERSSVYANCNAGKLGIALNFQIEAARDVARELASWADIVIESYAPGVMARWGLDYESLRQQNPGLIMLSSSLGGHVGPLASLAGFGNTGASLSGFQDLGGWPDRPPIGPFGPYTDYLGPRLGLVTLLGALDYRDRTGEGCYVDLSQIESGVYFLSPEIIDYLQTGHIAQRQGNSDQRFAPHGVYAAMPTGEEEEFVAIAVTTDQQWVSLAGLIGGEKLATDLRYERASMRLEREDELDALVGSWCAERSALDIEQTLQSLGVPAHRSSSTREFCEDEQFMHRHHLWRLPHAELGESVVEGPRYQLSLTPGIVQRSAPTMGQDRVFVLRDILGLSDDAIAELEAAGALQ